jgi:hypothetical protein
LASYVEAFLQWVANSAPATPICWGDRRRRAYIGMARARKVIAARVIPWENQYGIAVVFERGNHVAYPVGDREEAERQVQLVLNHPYDSAVLRKADD